MRLHELRKEKKFKQIEIANQINITQNCYSNYEKEKREPKIETLCKLADYYNVSLDYLVGREFDNEIGYITPEQKNVLLIIKKLNANNLNKILLSAINLLDKQ